MLSYAFFSLQLDFTRNAYRYQKPGKQNIASGVPRTFPSSEMEFFVIIGYSFKPLTIFIENSVLQVVGVLDPPLITTGLLVVSNKLIFCRLLKYKIIFFQNGCKVSLLELFTRNPLLQLFKLDR